MNVSSFRTKKGNGSNGVPVRYHKKEEYDLLNKAQRAELREWRMNKSAEGGKKKGGDRKFDTAKAIASAVDKKVNKRMKSIEEEKSTNKDTEAYIASVSRTNALLKMARLSRSLMRLQHLRPPLPPLRGKALLNV